MQRCFFHTTAEIFCQRCRHMRDGKLVSLREIKKNIIKKTFLLIVMGSRLIRVETKLWCMDLQLRPTAATGLQMKFNRIAGKRRFMLKQILLEEYYIIITKYWTFSFSSNFCELVSNGLQLSARGAFEIFKETSRQIKGQILVFPGTK